MTLRHVEHCDSASNHHWNELLIHHRIHSPFVVDVDATPSARHPVVIFLQSRFVMVWYSIEKVWPMERTESIDWRVWMIVTVHCSCLTQYHWLDQHHDLGERVSILRLTFDRVCLTTPDQMMLDVLPYWVSFFHSPLVQSRTTLQEVDFDIVVVAGIRRVLAVFDTGVGYFA